LQNKQSLTYTSYLSHHIEVWNKGRRC